MPQDSHIPFYHTTIRRKLQEVFKIFLRKLCGVKFPSKCNSKCCCCGCLDNLRICLLADGSTCPCRPLRGGLPSLPLANPAFSLLSCPIPPAPSPPGKGESQGLFRRGRSPRHPCPEPLAAFIVPAKRVPCAWEPAVRRKTERTAFPWAVPAAKERGDRGRWNYPSQATAAFEMVLSPGAGRTSAAGVQPPPGTTAARSAGDQPGKSPAGFMFEKVCRCRRRLNAGDARGGAPCMK